MDNPRPIRTGRHCVSQLHVHLVFVTKYRHNVFTEKHLDRLEQIVTDVCENFECTLVEFNGETDHIHLLVTFPPKVAISHLVNSLKGVSSRLLRREYPELETHYWRAKRLWAGSYYAGSVGGAPLDTLRTYIQNQTRPTTPALPPP